MRAAAVAAVVLSCVAAPALAQQPPGAKFPTAAKRNPVPVAEPGLPRAPAEGADAQRERAYYDYVLHCSGCHFLHGEGMKAGGIPRVRDQIGYFLALPEGRAYLMQVPGLLTAGLSDADAAGLVNWMIEQFSGASRPQHILPYTAQEARRYRLEKPADIVGKRRRLAAQLRAAGYPLQ